MLITFNCPSCGSSLEIEATAAGSEIQCPQCQSAVTIPRKGVEPGTTIGGFRIEKQLGEGGMGRVFLARQLSMDRNVALKVLLPEMNTHKDLVDSFIQEVHLTAVLKHANIVTAHDAGEDGGTYYMAMEYVNGEALDDRLAREGAMAEAEALAMIRKLADALRYAWEEHRILHRDIKPSNIMLDAHGEPRLTDMGLSKSVTGAEGMLITGTIMGTPNYMSPEHAKGETDIDYRTDIYSLGATLYHMISGQIPFESTSVMAILHKQINEPLPDPRESNPEVSEECVSLLEIMLAKDTAERYGSWGDLISDLDWVLQGRKPKQQRPGASTLMRAGVAPKQKLVVGHSTIERLHEAQASPPAAEKKRSKLPLVVGVLVVVVIAGAIAGVAAAKNRQVERTRRTALLATQQHEQAVAEQEAAEAKARQAALEQQLADALAHAEQNPDDYEGSAQRLEDAAAVGIGTDVEATAAEAIRRVKATREKAVADALDGLKAQAEALAGNGQIQTAIAVLGEYRGRFTTETAGERKRLAEAYERQLAEAKEAAAKQADAAKVGVQELLNALADDLLALDFQRAADRIAGAAEDENLNATPEWRETGQVAAKVAAMPQVILGTFEKDIGKEITVELSSGAEKLQIAEVTADGVKAKKLVRSQGRIVVSTDRKFTVSELSIKGKFQRLGASETPEAQIRRGLLAYQGKAIDKAREYFDRSDCRLGRMLSGRLTEMATREQAASLVEERAAQEDAAGEALRELLVMACPEIVKQRGVPSDAAGTKDFAREIRRTAFAELLGPRIRTAVADFRARHGGTEKADQMAAVLTALAHASTVPLEVDPSAVAQAIGELKKANPQAGDIFVNASTTESGIEIDLSGNAGLADISPLAALPLVKLNLAKTGVKDLRPLKGMPLAHLDLTECPVESVEPLRGMALKTLILFECRSVDDLRPLRGMPLEMLDLQYVGTADLAVLRGMPLKWLNLAGIKLTDPSPLEGLSLTNLSLNSNPVRELSSLKGMPLRSLKVYMTRVSDVRALRGMPLERLTISSATIRDLAPLEGMPLTFLHMYGSQQVRDLAPLAGMPLVTLSCSATGISNLTPLKGMPLRKLYLADTEVSDLTPLEGMQLTILHLSGAKVNDLTPIAGMPICKLTIDGTQVRDLTPLKDMPLKDFTFTPKTAVEGVDVIRTRLPALTVISVDGEHRWPPAEFWKKYDAGEFSK